MLRICTVEAFDDLMSIFLWPRLMVLAYASHSQVLFPTSAQLFLTPRQLKPATGAMRLVASYVISYPAKITPSPTTLWRFPGAYHLDFLATAIRIETFDMSGRDRGTRGRGERGGYESRGRGGGRGRRDGPGVPRRARRARRRTKRRACGGGGVIRQSSFSCQWIPTRLTLPGRAHTCFGGGGAPNPPWWT